MGTNLGRILIFKLFFNFLEKKYYYYTINFSNNDINILHIGKNLLFVSDSRGKFGVYDINSKSLSKSHLLLSEVLDNIIKIDVSNLKEFEANLIAPLKRVLKIKVLQPSNEDGFEISQDTLKQSKENLALILMNNSVVAFSISKKKIEFECKSNETTVLGVFLHPVYDYLLILNANGNINIFSTYTGRFERNINVKEYSHLLNVKELLKDYSLNYRNLHGFKNYIKDNRNTVSQTHGILEFNSRQIRNFLNYLNDNQINPAKRYELTWERLGNVKQGSYPSNDIPHLIWLMKYSQEFIYASKYKKNGAAFLNLFLDSSSINQEHQNSIAHLLLIDCKNTTHLRHFKKDPEEEKSQQGNQEEIKLRPRAKLSTLENITSQLSPLSFIHPWGFDAELDEEVKRISYHKYPAFAYFYGIQGIGESFSFIIEDISTVSKQNSEVFKDKDALQDNEINSKKSLIIAKNQVDDKISLPEYYYSNWQISNYLTTLHVMAYMVIVKVIL